MKNYLLRKNQKSFTLIEITIAAAIFVVILAVTIGTIGSVMRPKAKTKSKTNLQQLARQSMEMIKDHIERSDGKHDTENYLNFAITKGDGRVDTTMSGGQYIGYRLNTIYRFYSGASVTQVVKGFGIYKGENPIPADFDDDGDCDPSDPLIVRCRLGMMTSLDPTKVYPISSPDVDVTKFSLKGYYWIDGSTNNIAPYVEITMTIKSRYEGVESANLTLRTTVSPTFQIASRKALLAPCASISGASCKTAACITYSLCSEEKSGECPPNQFCCKGSCTTPPPVPTCSGVCKTNPCNTYSDCFDRSGTCSTGYCCSGFCTTPPVGTCGNINSCSRYGTSLACSMSGWHGGCCEWWSKPPIAIPMCYNKYSCSSSDCQSGNPCCKWK